MAEEVVIPGVSLAMRMPDLRTDDEIFPVIFDVTDDRSDDTKTADLIDQIGDLCEALAGKELSGPECCEALACLTSDPLFQQLVGFADLAAS